MTDFKNTLGNYAIILKSSKMLITFLFYSVKTLIVKQNVIEGILI